MKNNKSELFIYLKLVALLTVPIVLITIYSLSEKELNWGGLTLRKADVAAYFRKAKTEMASDASSAADAVVRDTFPQRILLFGDSMLEGLSKRMGQYAAGNHHELLNVIWYSSSTKIWSEHKDTLVHFINEFHPTYIMICLGGNELFIRDLDQREAYVKTILYTIKNIPYVWIGPPNWKKDTGINDVIKRNVGTSRFFPSGRLTYQRASDGAHPTYASAAMWMDSVAHWMNDSIPHRILMKSPVKTAPQSGKNVFLKPLK